ncbi:MAG: hypothetical protein CK425_02930 [Parachlamydia sp.]|nr:MAG: hypothetical protein CK425_02930 [Parachlamydia sp.]
MQIVRSGLLFWGEQARVIQGKVTQKGSALEIQAPHSKYPKKKILLKIGICATGIIPLIALTYKSLYRLTSHFEVIQLQTPKKLNPGFKTSASVNPKPGSNAFNTSHIPHTLSSNNSSSDSGQTTYYPCN